MTHDELRLVAATKLYAEASADYQSALDALNDHLSACDTKPRSATVIAVNRLQSARAAQIRAYLAMHGITPMHTIFQWYGFSFAVMVTCEGQAEMFRVTTRNRKHMIDTSTYTPPSWNAVSLTDRVLIVGADKTPAAKANKPPPSKPEQIKGSKP